MLRFRRDRVATTPSASTGIGHRRCGPARPPRNALRRFTLVRHHDTPMASFRPALTETPQRITKPHWDRPVNSGPRPCLFSVGFPLSGLQVRTYTSDLNIRAQHTRSGLALRARPSRRRAVCSSTPSQRQEGANSRPLTPLPGSNGVVQVSTGVDTTIAFSLEEALWIKRSQRVRSFGERFAANFVSTSNSTADKR